MEKSKVYFCDMRVSYGTNTIKKMQKLMKSAGIENIDFKNKFTAIKMHFGEPGNIAFLRPNFAKGVADVVKDLGGIPFLTDCSTLYPGRRKNAVEHLDAAMENGFSPLSTGCQIIMGDGLKGNDEEALPVPNGILLKEANIGKVIADSDVIISLNHFKGHEMTGIGGAIKNLGMGCASKSGKMIQHNSGKPDVKSKKCVGCKTCAKECAHSAITFGEDKKAFIDHEKCVGCGRCIGACAFDAIVNNNASSNDDLNMKMTEYAAAVIHNKPSFHISIVMDVSPFCDCNFQSDTPIIPDVGMFASFDPVALDKACADACNKMPVNPGSLLDESIKKHCCSLDHFTTLSPDTNWSVGIDHGVKIGLGSTDYELIKID